MESIAHIVSPLNAAWSAWMMFVLLLFAVVSEFLQPGVITKSGASLRVHFERAYKDAPTNYLSQFLITLFRIGTFAMGLCLCLCPNESFTFSAFIAICTVIFVIIAVKMLCNVLLDYTFELSRRFGSVYEHFANIFTMVACILYPCLLVLLRIGNREGSRWVVGIMTIVFVLLWIYRSARVFINTPMAILYFILYIITLEILPLGIILYLSSQTLLLI